MPQTEERRSSEKTDKEQSDKENNSTSRRKNKTQPDEARKHEYFKAELTRLKSSLDKKSSKIRAPERKKYVPFTFNSLEPYFNTKTAGFVINQDEDEEETNDETSESCRTKPDESRNTFKTRNTAQGLVDPWVELQMRSLSLTRSRTSSPQRKTERTTNTKQKSKERPPKEGSTRLPSYPAVRISADDSSSRRRRKLDYSDVPKLRKELRKKYLGQAGDKFKAEYKRTKQDFYRMELDKMEEFHPISRPHMRACYFAYLQNNDGSKKAVKECVKAVEKEEEEEDKQTKEETTQRTGSSGTCKKDQESEPSQQKPEEDDQRKKK